MISDLEITERLAVAAVLGGVVGFERERLLWAAGIRTHMLVSVGACLLIIVSAYGFQHVLAEPKVILDPSRIAAQVVSGIGFLGAGAILLRGQVVRGLTTAASIWAVAAIGLAAGGGLFFAATISTAIILVILAGLKPIEEAYRSKAQSCVLQAVVERNAVDPAELKKLLRLRAGQIRQVVIDEAEPGQTQRMAIALTRVSHEDINRAASRFREAQGVLELEVLQGRRRRELEHV